MPAQGDGPFLLSPYQQPAQLVAQLEIFVRIGHIRCEACLGDVIEAVWAPTRLSTPDIFGHRFVCNLLANVLNAKKILICAARAGMKKEDENRPPV